MKLLQRVWHGVKTAGFASACWLTVCGVAVAEEQKKEEGSGGDYVLMYFLVILGVALGMLLICRPSRRRDRARPEQFAESKVSKVEEE
jgi:hypothetical protein